jgi:hypothetical protein
MTDSDSPLPEAPEQSEEIPFMWPITSSGDEWPLPQPKFDAAVVSAQLRRVKSLRAAGHTGTVRQLLELDGYYTTQSTGDESFQCCRAMIDSMSPIPSMTSTDSLRIVCGCDRCCLEVRYS